jgi:hypothetical protein
MQLNGADRALQLEKFRRMTGERRLFVQSFPSRLFRIIHTADAGAMESMLDILETEQAEAIFFGVNPMREGVKDAPRNEDIERRCSLFLDVDHPDHHKNTPATEEGKRIAYATFDQINVFLRARGWPAPIKIDSGNGPHGYWQIDLPNDQVSAALVAGWLAVLKLKFGPLVDTANSDARRLGRVPGTWNRRGEETRDRPYRQCRFVEFPEHGKLVTTVMIQAVINEIDAEQNTRKSEQGDFSQTAKGDGMRPGDDYNRRANWRDILEPIGFKIDKEAGKTFHWTRPGKDSGTSATTGHCNGETSGELLYLFTPNAPPFNVNTAYSKFSAYTLLNHGGDYSAAAKALAQEGYGIWPRAKKNDAPSTRPIQVQNVQLIATDGRKTKGGKLVVTVAIMKGGSQVDVLTVSSASSSRHATAKDIAKYIEAPEMLKIDMALGQVMTVAAELAQRARGREGDTVREIVARLVTTEFAPAYRTPGGFFSESKGREIRRQDLLAYTPSKLIDTAANGCDAPIRDDGEVNRASLLCAIKAELEILYADLVSSLPVATGANLQEHSAAAREFRNAMVKVLTTPKTWTASPEGSAQRASLISRAVEQVRGCRAIGNTPGWIKVISACNLWWRTCTFPDGETRPLLALRWELCHQIGVFVSGVSDQESLVSLGVRYGVIDPNPPKAAKVNHGNVRIAVLRGDFVAPLLAVGDNRPMLDADEVGQ